jgi:hypothetical protein
VGIDSITQIAFEIWRLDPPRNLSGFHDNVQVHLTWRVPESVEGGLDEWVRYDISRNDSLVGQSELTQFSEPLPGTEIYTYHVRAVYAGGQSDTSNPQRIDGSVAVNENGTGLPREFRVSAAFPNPFNSTSSFELALPAAEHVRATIHNITGQRVAELVNARVAAGYHHLNWDARSFASGLYILCVQAADYVSAQKLLLIR